MEKLKALLEYGVTASHVIDYMKHSLVEAGYEVLVLDEAWELKEGGKYFVDIYGTNGIAFQVGMNINEKMAFRIGMAHSDYPCFQLKPNPTITAKNGKNEITKWNVEIYGGMYQKSWLDRPLGVAGKVIVKGESTFLPKELLYKSDKPLAIIPSLAIHWDRELNKKGALDTAKELVPIASLLGSNDLLAHVADALNIKKEEILDYDLYLYNCDLPQVIGLDDSMISSPRLDNLTSVGALLSAMCEMKEVPQNVVDIMSVFDNEEVGSLSKQGADSSLLSVIINKIGKSLNDGFDYDNVMKSSFLLSVDVAHGHHPNYEEKSDSTNKAYLGSGFSIKRSVGQKYGTTANTAAVIRQICEANDISYTVAINKTGIPGGSTLGPIVSSHFPAPCADIGMPILAMHSATELGVPGDYKELEKFILCFYTNE